MVCLFMVCLEERSEARVDLELQDVDGERCAVDLVGAEPARGTVDALVEAIAGAEDVALGVGPAKVEGGIVETIRQGIRLDVL